jgi:drug/metabolite transporter (DMT)-like permease
VTNGLALLALVTAVCFGVSDFLGGTLSRRLPQLTVLVLSQAVVVVSNLPRVVSDPPAGDVGAAVAWGAVGGVAVAVAIAALFRALAIGTMGVVAPLAGLSVAVPLLAGVSAGEPLGPVLIVGIIAAVIGTILTSGPELRAGDLRAAAKPILLALLSAVGFGVSSLTLARGSAHDVTSTLLANSVTAFVVYAVVAVARRHVPRASGRQWVGIAAIGVLGFLANLCFAIASLSGLLSVVAVLGSLFPAVTALLGWFVHKERLRAVQVVGVVLVLAGAAVIASSG